MKQKTTERDVKKSVKDYLELKGWTVFTLYAGGIYNAKSKGYYSHNPAGLPDLLCYHKKMPVMLFLEIKGSGGKVSPEQTKFIEAVNGIEGVFAQIVWSLDEIILFDKKLRGKYL